MRRIFISETAFKEIELYADGLKLKDIRGILGSASQATRIKDTFFKVLNFGYEGTIPENVVPKYTPEELCKRVFERADYGIFDFKHHSPITREEYLMGSVKCGRDSLNKEISLDSDIRCLDLSATTFNPIMRRYSRSDVYGPHKFCEGPFTIRNLVELGEDGLFMFQGLGAKGRTELKEELAKFGLGFDERKKALSDVIEDAQKSDDLPLMLFEEKVKRCILDFFDDENVPFSKDEEKDLCSKIRKCAEGYFAGKKSHHGLESEERNYACDICGIIEDILEEKDITIPDDSREDYEEDEEDLARLFGDAYYEIEDAITALFEEVKNQPVKGKSEKNHLENKLETVR